MFADTDRMRFAIRQGGVATYPPGATFGPRTLRDHEFVWIISGDVEWNVDGTLVSAPEGTLLLARPGQHDRFRWDPRHRTRHGYVHFDLDANGASLPPAEQWPLARQLPEQDVIRPLFHHLGRLLGRGDAASRELAQGALRQALLAFLSGEVGAGDMAANAGHPLIDRALEYVQERWAEAPDALDAITLGDLARSAGVSKTHLSRVFQQVLGTSPAAALRQLRLDRAATLLARSNLNVQAVAEATGFASAFHFSRVFRALYGRSPRAFRAAIAGGETPALNRLTRTALMIRH